MNSHVLDDEARTTAIADIQSYWAGFVQFVVSRNVFYDGPAAKASLAKALDFLKSTHSSDEAALAGRTPENETAYQAITDAMHAYWCELSPSEAKAQREEIARTTKPSLKRRAVSTEDGAKAADEESGDDESKSSSDEDDEEEEEEEGDDKGDEDYEQEEDEEEGDEEGDECEDEVEEEVDDGVLSNCTDEESTDDLDLKPHLLVCLLALSLPSDATRKRYIAAIRNTLGKFFGQLLIED